MSKLDVLLKKEEMRLGCFISVWNISRQLRVIECEKKGLSWYKHRDWYCLLQPITCLCQAGIRVSVERGQFSVKLL
jgi:hypothetical protein